MTIPEPDPLPNRTPPMWHVLLVEDSPDDAELIGFALRNAPNGVNLRRVETEPEFRAALEGSPTPDAILCDYHLPRFSMPRALQIVRDECHLDIPFIVVSRVIGEDAAVEAMQKGANDYLLKGRLGRLAAALVQAIEGARTRREKEAADAALKRSDLLNRSLLNSISMRIAVVDAGGNVIASNRAWQRFNEAPAGSDPGASAPVNLLDRLSQAHAVPAAAAAQVRAGLEAVIEHRQPHFSHEYEVTSRAGTRWERVSAEPLEDRERGAVVSVEDVTSRMLSHLALHDANQRLRMLSRRVLGVQEEERRAIALELHDDIGQSLAALKIALHNLNLTQAGGLPSPKLAQCVAVADETLEKLRRLSYSLRPPQLDEFGLEGALRELVRGVQEATGIAIECRFETDGRRAPPTVEVACYRIVQEALNNATRHSQATGIVVELQFRDRLLQVAIRDNGRGFDEAEATARASRAGSLGLVGMAERAELAGGRLRVRSATNAGTVVSAVFATDASADRAAAELDEPA